MTKNMGKINLSILKHPTYYLSKMKHKKWMKEVHKYWPSNKSSIITEQEEKFIDEVPDSEVEASLPSKHRMLLNPEKM